MSDYQKILSAVKMAVKDELTSIQQKAVLSALSDLKKAYDKVQKGGGGRMRGGSFWDWLKIAANDVNKFLKDTKLLSKVASPILKYMIPIAAGAIGSPVSGIAAAAAGEVASLGIKSLGYGRSMLVINQKNQRMRVTPVSKKLMMGSGCGCGQMGGGFGSAYYSSSSQFGKILV